MSKKPLHPVYRVRIKRYNHRPIYCHETKKYYKTFAEAAEDTGTDPRNVARACRGKLTHHHGLHFVFEDP